jgi:uncharacterized membrane protein
MEWIFKLPHEIAVILVGMLPIFELRGAIPLGFYFGLPVLKNFTLSVLGNMIPVVPLLFLLTPVSERLRRIPLWNRFFDWLFERTKKKADLIQKYEALGLALFVAVPLPMTGAWSGVIAASLFKIRFRYAFPAIFIGVILAGIIVTIFCMLGKMSWSGVQ